MRFFVLDRLLDRRRHLVGLGVAAADLAASIADHDQAGETEPPATLDDGRAPPNLDDLLGELAGSLFSAA
jgi:hypothetical protein